MSSDRDISLDEEFPDEEHPEAVEWYCTSCDLFFLAPLQGLLKPGCPWCGAFPEEYEGQDQ